MSSNFTGTGDDTSKVEKILNCAPINNAFFSQSVTPACQLSEPASKRQKIDASNLISIASDDDVKTVNSDNLWLRIEFMDKNSFALSALDKVILQNGSYLNDKHITVAQKLLCKQFQYTTHFHLISKFIARIIETVKMKVFFVFIRFHFN